MIALRGDTDSRPALTGKSTQNTRIERLWGVYNPKVNHRFRAIFQGLEDRGILSNRDSESDEWAINRYCLTRVFLARIQVAASNFAATWDYHKVSTEGNKSPLRLWLDGWRMSPATSQQFHNPQDDNYASEYNPMDSDSLDVENPDQVVIPSVEIPAGIDHAWLESTAIAC
jgi:hypothetical protein